MTIELSRTLMVFLDGPLARDQGDTGPFSLRWVVFAMSNMSNFRETPRILIMELSFGKFMCSHISTNFLKTSRYTLHFVFCKKDTEEMVDTDNWRSTSCSRDLFFFITFLLPNTRLTVNWIFTAFLKFLFTNYRVVILIKRVGSLLAVCVFSLAIARFCSLREPWLFFFVRLF